MLQVFHLEPNIFLHLNVKSRVIRLQDSPQKPIESTKHLKSDVSAAAAAKSLQSCPTLATPQMAAHKVPPSLGFSSQERWSGLPFPSPMHEVKSEVAQSYPTLSDPMAYSLPGSSIHGIF